MDLPVDQFSCTSPSAPNTGTRQNHKISSIAALNFSLPLLSHQPILL